MTGSGQKIEFTQRGGSDAQRQNRRPFSHKPVAVFSCDDSVLLMISLANSQPKLGVAGDSRGL
jgi:hypothetical protein